MKLFHPLRISALTLLVLAGPHASVHAQQASPQSPPPVPVASTALASTHSCRDIAALSKQYDDGIYWLRLQGQPVQLYCHDMAGKPREYLELPEGNCSEYGSNTDGVTRRLQTCFRKVRIDPESLRVDVGDLAFSHTRKTGIIRHGQMVVEAMPYATAMACDAPDRPVGRASINLSGTGFAVVDTFRAQGYQARGEAHQDDSGQRWELEGGGFCGWIAPGTVYNPMITLNGDPFENSSGYLLQLRLVTERQQGRKPAGRCYWMENYSGQYQWVPANTVYGREPSREECFELDSCNGGKGRSGGGCYRWSAAVDSLQ